MKQIIEESRKIITYSGGNGSSKESAVIINGAANESIGVRAEFLYLANRYGTENQEWQREYQILLNENGKSYDLIQIKLNKNNSIISAYFDITSFYNKH